MDLGRPGREQGPRDDLRRPPRGHDVVDEQDPSPRNGTAGSHEGALEVRPPVGCGETLLLRSPTGLRNGILPAGKTKRAGEPVGDRLRGEMSAGKPARPVMRDRNDGIDRSRLEPRRTGSKKKLGQCECEPLSGGLFRGEDRGPEFSVIHPERHGRKESVSLIAAVPAPFRQHAVRTDAGGASRAPFAPGGHKDSAALIAQSGGRRSCDGYGGVSRTLSRRRPGRNRNRGVARLAAAPGTGGGIEEVRRRPQLGEDPFPPSIRNAGKRGHGQHRSHNTDCGTSAGTRQRPVPFVTPGILGCVHSLAGATPRFEPDASAFRLISRTPRPGGIKRRSRSGGCVI